MLKNLGAGTALLMAGLLGLNGLQGVTNEVLAAPLLVTKNIYRAAVKVMASLLSNGYPVERVMDAIDGPLIVLS